MTRKQTIALLLLAAMLAAVSCGNNSGGEDTQPNGNDTTPVENSYDFQGKDFGGYEFSVLNLDYQWGSYINLDFAEQTGEQLDDSVYDRNRYIEEQLGFNFNEIILARGYEWQTGQEAACDAVMQQVMSDGDDYDAAYIPVTFRPDILAENYLYNLTEIPEMHIYEDYWDSAINEALTINDTLYVAAGPLNMMTTHTSWVLMFNQDMMNDNMLEYPYQLVHDGKWTLDKMNEYTAAVANLNGDESFNYTEGGNARYGIAAHTSVPAKLMFSAGVSMYEIDENNEITLTFGGEHVYNTLQKIYNLSTISDGKGIFEQYNTLFGANRALFNGCELKDVQWFRDTEEFTFGILPYPKYDESQENYRVSIGETSVFLTIPITQDDTARAGLILDALTFESKQSVLPVFYDVTLSQKNLRDDESIEMLEVIWNNREINLLSFYGIDNLCAPLGKLVSNSNDISSASSLIATNQVQMQQKLEDFLALMND